jgi:hypothetical protein
MQTIDQTRTLKVGDCPKATETVATAPVSGMAESRAGRDASLGQPPVRYIKLGKAGDEHRTRLSAVLSHSLATCRSHGLRSRRLTGCETTADRFSDTSLSVWLRLKRNQP